MSYQYNLFKVAINICWLRRDLRLNDNTALYHALKNDKPVQLIFIFDKNILERLEDTDDARVTFIHDEVRALNEAVQSYGSAVQVYYGEPLKVWKDLINQYEIAGVYANRDYEHYAIDRDKGVSELLATHSIEFKTFKDHVVFEKGEVLKNDGTPYTVFTPYKRKWLERFTREGVASFPSEQHLDNLVKAIPTKMISLQSMGFVRSTVPIPPRVVNRGVVKSYNKTRDFPAIEGTTRLGIHFRFGTLSIRKKCRLASDLNDTYLSELIWRDFYSQILAHFPHVEKQAFRPKYDRIHWRNNEMEFEKWCAGETGYPIVDAGMRQLNEIGYMHNRVRMITASFLTKHLLIDWRWGEAYFARKLLDFDLASNNGGWQWAAGSGTDAAPYFRIFNPTTQQQKFDRDFRYIKAWVPEWETDDYPDRIVDHKFARERCLETYKAALG